LGLAWTSTQGLIDAVRWLRGTGMHARCMDAACDSCMCSDICPDIQI
jgi:hypothetical protein